MIPEDKRAAFQNSLGELIQEFIDPDAIKLSAEQEAEIDRRLAETEPRYATAEEMASVWGKPFPS